MILVRLEAALSYFRTNDGIVLVLVKPQKVGTTAINLRFVELCARRDSCAIMAVVTQLTFYLYICDVNT